MTKPFGINILAQYVKDQSSLQAWFKAAQPEATVVMDSPLLAQTLKGLSPSTLVIHRTYHPRDSDFENYLSPQDWLKAFAVAGVALQVSNEPNPSGVYLDRYFDWLISLMQIATAQGVQLVVGNFAVGTPNEVDIAAGRYDRLLQALAQSQHLLGLHEYFNLSPLADAPYLVGRFKFWLDRAHALGISRPKVVITEHGHDLGNGGWKTALPSSAVFIQYLKEARSLYLPYDIPVCIFCYGYGANHQWESWDVEDAPDVLSFMKSYSERSSPMPEVQAPVNPIAQMPMQTSDKVNLRFAPSTTALVRRLMPKGERVTPFATDPLVKDDLYTWWYIKTATDEGWSASKFFAPISQNVPLHLSSPFDGGFLVTSPFGVPRHYPGYAHDMKHEGIDLVPKVKTCAPFLRACADGVVEKIEYNPQGYGNACVLDHGNGWKTWYGHQACVPLVCVGQQVKNGDIIGVMGATGEATGPHLHLTVQHLGFGQSDQFVLPDVVDPLPLLSL